MRLGAIFVGLNSLDAALTQVGLTYFSGYEGNPLERLIISYSWLDFWRFKVGLALVGSLLFVAFAKRYPRLRKVFIGGIGLMAGVCLFNLMMLFL
jgi:hypothetical protein